MPLVDWNDPAVWAANYDIGGEPQGYPSGRAEVRVRYTRAALWEESQDRAAQFVELLGLTTADSVVIFGSAFGWTAEALVANHGIETVGVDTSTYIQNNKDVSEEPDLEQAITSVGLDPTVGEGDAVKAALVQRGGGSGNRARVPLANEDLSNAGSRNRVKKLLSSGTVTVVLTEDLLSSLTDAEIESIISRSDQLEAGVRVAHFLTTLETIAPSAPPVSLNGKTLAQWRALIDSLGFPAHLLIEAGTYRVA